MGFLKCFQSVATLIVAGVALISIPFALIVAGLLLVLDRITS